MVYLSEFLLTRKLGSVLNKEKENTKLFFKNYIPDIFLFGNFKHLTLLKKYDA